MNFEEYTKEELVTLCDVYNKKILYLQKELDYTIAVNRHVEIHPIKTMFTENEVKKILVIQIMNCRVAAMKETNDETILDKISLAPFPHFQKKK